MKPWRSLLFVPVNDAARVKRVHERGADAIILDLEDGVDVEAKPAARRMLDAAFGQLAGKGSDILVRINSGWRDAFADLEVAVRPELAAVVAPKVEGRGRIESISGMIGDIEADRGLPVGDIGVLAMVESARGMAELAAIAAAPRMIGFAFGSEDFALDLGVSPTAEVLDLPCRQLALAAAAYSLKAFAMPISITAFRDDVLTRSAATRARAYGCSGALCVHPGQVAIVNDAFAPSSEERQKAEAVLAAWRAAQAEGLAVATLDGRMIDRPVAERARRLLEK